MMLFRVIRLVYHMMMIKKKWKKKSAITYLNTRSTPCQATLLAWLVISRIIICLFLLSDHWNQTICMKIGVKFLTQFTSDASSCEERDYDLMKNCAYTRYAIHATNKVEILLSPIYNWLFFFIYLPSSHKLSCQNVKIDNQIDFVMMIINVQNTEMKFLLKCLHGRSKDARNETQKTK